MSYASSAPVCRCRGSTEQSAEHRPLLVQVCSSGLLGRQNRPGPVTPTHQHTPGSRPGQVESVVVWCSAAVRGVARRCAQWQRYVRRLVDNGTSYPWARAPQSAAAAPPCSDTWTRGTPCSPPSPCWPPAWPSPPPGTSTDSPSSSTRIPRMCSTALRLV